MPRRSCRPSSRRPRSGKRSSRSWRGWGSAPSRLPSWSGRGHSARRRRPSRGPCNTTRTPSCRWSTPIGPTPARGSGRRSRPTLTRAWSRSPRRPSPHPRTPPQGSLRGSRSRSAPVARIRCRIWPSRPPDPSTWSRSASRRGPPTPWTRARRTPPTGSRRRRARSPVRRSGPRAKGPSRS